MIAYIHPIDHHFSVLYDKTQNWSEVSYLRLHQGIALDPLGGLQLPLKPQLQSFLALPKPDASIFFLYYPLQ